MRDDNFKPAEYCEKSDQEGRDDCFNRMRNPQIKERPEERLLDAQVNALVAGVSLSERKDIRWNEEDEKRLDDFWPHQEAFAREVAKMHGRPMPTAEELADMKDRYRELSKFVKGKK